MSSLSQFDSGGGKIKSIQRGVITITAPPNSINNIPGYLTQTATISPVNTSKSILFVLGQQNGITYHRVPTVSTNSWSGGAVLASLELTNSTTITATSGYQFGNQSGLSYVSNFTVAPKISWQLVEYY